MQQFKLNPPNVSSGFGGFGHKQMSVKLRKDLLGPEEKETIKAEIRKRRTEGPMNPTLAICLGNMFKRLPATIMKFAAEIENE